MTNFTIIPSIGDLETLRSEMYAQFEAQSRHLDEHGANFGDLYTRVESLERRFQSRYAGPVWQPCDDESEKP